MLERGNSGRSFQLSIINYQLSVISYQLLVLLLIRRQENTESSFSLGLMDMASKSCHHISYFKNELFFSLLYQEECYEQFPCLSDFT